MQTKQQLIVRKNTSGVAFLFMDGPGKANVLATSVIDELNYQLDEIKKDSSITALVILSGKPDSFIIGADLYEINKVRDCAEAFNMARAGQIVLSKLENLGKPIVVGINGACLGGGLEMALSCNKRIATNKEHTILGLPEVRLGIIPGMGGTQRLPKLVGLKAALDLIVSSNPISAEQALAIGLIDSVVNPDNLIDQCHMMALDLVTNKNLLSKKTEETPKENEKILSLTERSVRIKTKGKYPSYTRVVEVVRHGLKEGIESGFEFEAKTFAELAVSDIAKNLITLFFNTEFAKQTAGLMAARAQAKPINTIAIIGAGTMGLAIAEHAALNGYKVLLKSTSRNKNDRPLERLKLDAQFLKQVQMADDALLNKADLVIEASFEDQNVKVDLLKRIENIVSADCVIASNTSSFSINQLATCLKDNSRFIGMHFFLPVDRMPLVEIITHGKTRRDVTAQASSVVSKLGKIPIIVNDGPGFLVNRLLCTYILEAARLAESGVPLNWIDEAALDFGMAIGPLAVLDEVGLDIAFKVADALHNGLGERMTPPDVFNKARKLGLIGKKAGDGIYLWDENGKRLSFNPKLNEIGLSITDQKLPPEKSAWIANRLILPMIDEAAYCLEDKIVRKAREIDLAMVLGTGFPAFRGGPLKYADSIDMSNLCQNLDEIYKDSSKRQTSNLIKRMEAEKRRFYSRASGAENSD